jgi:hypothetical protein
MTLVRRPHVLAFLLWATVANAAPPHVDFTEQTIEGEVLKPSGSHVLEKPKTTFRCDITRLTLEQYNVCFEKHLAELCGMQVIERDRYELETFAQTATQGGSARTVGSAYPYSMYLHDGAVYAQESSEFDMWSESKLLLKNQSPKLASMDYFVALRNSFILGDRASRRVFIVGRNAFDEGMPRFQKIEIADPGSVLIGIVSTSRLIVATPREVLSLNLNGKAGIRLKVPVDHYVVDPRADRAGQILLTSTSRGGKVYVVDGKGEVTGAFDRESDFRYYLLPNGVIASASLSQGIIKIRSHTGVVLSRTKLGRSLYQFGVYGQPNGADLFYVAADGLGVLYRDGFEKSFLARDGRGLRVTQAEDGVLAVLTSSPSWEDAKKWRERSVEFYRLGRSPSRISRLVEGICPNAIKAAERALELNSALKATVKNGRFDVHR